MPDILNSHQLLQLAQCLTRMQSAMTDYELHHYAELGPAQKKLLEETLTRLASAAGRLYAYSAQLVFQETGTQLKQLQQATDGLKKFLKTAQKIQQVLDIAGTIALLAEALISQDLEGITVGINEISRMMGNN